MFAERLKEARKAKRYSQAEVSRLLGVTQQAVGKWETGRSTPDPQTIAGGNSGYHGRCAAGAAERGL